MALQASCWHLVQHTRLTVVDRGRVVAPTRGRVCGAVQAMASPMGCVGPPPGRQASARQGHLRVPLSAAPRRRPRSVVMVGSRSSRRRWMRSRAMAHTAVVCSSKKLRLPPSQQSPASSAHGAAGADDALVVLIKLRWPDASPRCQPADCLSVDARGGVVWGRPHDQDQLCRVRTLSSVGVWVVWAFRVHDLQCTGVWQHTVCGFHPVSLSSPVPEVIVCALAGDIRPGKKCVDQAFACLCMRGR